MIKDKNDDTTIYLIIIGCNLDDVELRPMRVRESCELRKKQINDFQREKISHTTKTLFRYDHRYEDGLFSINILFKNLIIIALSGN